MKSIPGDPFIQDQEIPQETLDALYRYYGLDKPLYIQYLKYIKSFLKADFGPSYIYHGRGVNQIIKEGFPVSARLGIQALLIALFFGVSFGSIAALKKTNTQGNLASILTIIGISLPNFLLATLLQYLFSIKFKLLPIARWDSVMHTILPSIALAAMPTAFIARLTRANMLEVLEQDYIKTAYAKGLTHFQVIKRHALRNSIIPVISYLGPVTTYVLTGSFVIEKIFAIPGLGQWLIMSISNRDYPVILGIAIFFSIILMTLVLITDIIIVFLDPRIKLQRGKIDA